MNKKYNNIFLGVVGLTPQIITECIYYYYHPYYKKNRHFDRIKVFTSEIGKEKIINTILKINDENNILSLINSENLSISNIKIKNNADCALNNS